MLLTTGELIGRNFGYADADVASLVRLCLLERSDARFRVSERARAEVRGGMAANAVSQAPVYQMVGAPAARKPRRSGRFQAPGPACAAASAPAPARVGADAGAPRAVVWS